MLSIFAIAAAPSSPITREEGSLKCESVAAGASVLAGVGVEGRGAVTELNCDGAAGGVDVAVTAWVGVDGPFEEEAVVVGPALGCSTFRLKTGRCHHNLTFVTMQTMKPFSSILYDSTVFASCRILPSRRISETPKVLCLRTRKSNPTQVAAV